MLNDTLNSNAAAHLRVLRWEGQRAATREALALQSTGSSTAAPSTEQAHPVHTGAPVTGVASAARAGKGSGCQRRGPGCAG